MTTNKKESRKDRAERMSRWKLEVETLKKKPPGEGQPHTKCFTNKDHPSFKHTKTWHWCPHHLMWTLHIPSECKLGKDQTSKRSQYKTSSKTTKDEAMAAIIKMFSPNNEDSDSE